MGPSTIWNLACRKQGCLLIRHVRLSRPSCMTDSKALVRQIRVNTSLTCARVKQNLPSPRHLPRMIHVVIQGRIRIRNGLHTGHAMVHTGLNKGAYGSQQGCIRVMLGHIRVLVGAHTGPSRGAYESCQGAYGSLQGCIRVSVGCIRVPAGAHTSLTKAHTSPPWAHTDPQRAHTGPQQADTGQGRIQDRS